MKKGQATDELEEMFEELGELEEFRAGVQKRLIADQLRKVMQVKKITPAEMARRMKTSRSAVYGLLDPEKSGATLDTLGRAANALNLDVHITFTPRKRPRGTPGPARRRAA
jgi:hypothetical protein